ncbi:beta-glucanase, partial [Limosilactobacillus reuteri]
YGTLVEHEKYIFSKPLPVNNYYDATLIVLAALNTNELTGLEK